MPSRIARLSIVLVMGVVLFVAVGCDSGASPEEQAAVEAVWDKYILGMAESVLDENKKPIFDQDLIYVSRVKIYKDIDVSRCPKGFQQAWENYLVEYTKHDPTPVIKAEPGTLDYALEMGKSMEDLRKAESHLVEAFKRYSDKLALDIARAEEDSHD